MGLLFRIAMITSAGCCDDVENRNGLELKPDIVVLPKLLARVEITLMLTVPGGDDEWDGTVMDAEGVVRISASNGVSGTAMVALASEVSTA